MKLEKIQKKGNIRKANNKRDPKKKKEKKIVKFSYISKNKKKRK